jgi:precorrin-4 C11-methyltransferase
MAAFVNEKPTVLLLEARDEGTEYLESTLPAHVRVCYQAEEIKAEDEVILAVTPNLHDFGAKAIYYRPAMLHLGIGCQRDLPYESFRHQLTKCLEEKGWSPLSIASLNTVDIKADEEAFTSLSKCWNVPLRAYENTDLAKYDSPNPSEKVQEVTGSASVSEAAAMHASGNQLHLPKTKLKADDKFFTVAVAIDWQKERKGFVEFVGAGPGDPELVSVRGKKLLQMADLILYAGSLVPKELTYYAKKNCVVKSSAGMDLHTQIDTMAPFYERGLFVVRLHTGDPCIYGAIQEQMAVMDQRGWSYKITPGISSFQAAAAALKSQFTIPEEVQTIILTRGEGRTPMPDKEQLHKLAQSQSTMCIYLSASIAEKVERDLLVHYPPETPVAVCYKLTWKDEKVYRCTLQNLAQTVRENNLSMTTMIVVGKAIDNRQGVSKLYDRGFTHAFREGK